MFFWRALVWSNMHAALYRIWTWVANYISYDDYVRTFAVKYEEFTSLKLLWSFCTIYNRRPLLNRLHHKIMHQVLINESPLHCHHSQVHSYSVDTLTGLTTIYPQLMIRFLFSLNKWEVCPNLKMNSLFFLFSWIFYEMVKETCKMML